MPSGGNNFKDITGQIFGRLTAIKLTGRSRNKKLLWQCQCECGKTVVVLGAGLFNGHTKSCGCLKRDMASIWPTKHGQSRVGRKTKEYTAWRGVVDRCTNPNNSAWKHYGARGIEVCERWRNSFENFFDDMGAAPNSKSTIDRINNDKGYESSNCRWATMNEQARNRRNNRIIAFSGRSQCLAAWGHELGLSSDILSDRLRLGWSIEKALTTPLLSRTGRHEPVPRSQP